MTFHQTQVSRPKPTPLMPLIFDMLNSHSSRPEPSAFKAKWFLGFTSLQTVSWKSLKHENYSNSSQAKTTFPLPSNENGMPLSLEEKGKISYTGHTQTDSWLFMAGGHSVLGTRKGQDRMSLGPGTATLLATPSKMMNKSNHCGEGTDLSYGK